MKDLESLRHYVSSLNAELEQEWPDIGRVEVAWRELVALWNSRRMCASKKSPSKVPPKENTQRSRDWDVSQFYEYCDERLLSPSGDNVVAHGKWMLSNGYAPGTVYRRINSVAHSQRQFGLKTCLELNEVKCFIAHLGKVPHRSRSTAVIKRRELKEMLFNCPDSALGARDRVALLLAWELRGNRSMAEINWDSVSQLSDGTVQVQVNKHLPPLEIMAGDDSDLSLDIAINQWGTYCPRQGRLLRRIDRYGNIRSELSGEGLLLVIQRAGRRAGIDLPLRLVSFRRSTIVSSSAICRIGRRGIAA